MDDLIKQVLEKNKIVRYTPTFVKCLQDYKRLLLAQSKASQLGPLVMPNEVIVGGQFTNPSTLPNDIKLKLIAIRDALIIKNIDEAYHILYSIASPSFDNYDAWSAIEKLKPA